MSFQKDHFASRPLIHTAFVILTEKAFPLASLVLTTSRFSSPKAGMHTGSQQTPDWLSGLVEIKNEAN